MSNLRVLIAGASIAGPTTAYFLARSGTCATITLLERYPSPRPGGQNVDIRSIGVSVMRSIPGMQAAVEAKRPPIDAFTWVDDDGKAFARMEATGDADAQSLVSEFEVYRGDLSGIICDYLKPYERDGRVKFVYDEQIASISSNGSDADGPVTVTFQNGHLPPTEYDLVIGADGSHSRTRALAFNTTVRAHMRPVNCWAAYFTVPYPLLGPDDPGAAHNAPGGRFFGMGRSPCGGTKGIIMQFLPSSSSAPRSKTADTTPSNEKTAEPDMDTDPLTPFRLAQKTSDAALKHHISTLYADAGWLAPSLLQGMYQSPDFYASEIVQIHAPALSSPNRPITLVGDSAYASGFGTGTSLALCGAYVLAGEIMSHPDSLREGLEGYERVMRPVVRAMQTSPPFVASFLAPQTGWGLGVRNVLLRLVCWGMRWWGKYFSWVGRWAGSAFGGGEEFRLPEYEWVA